MTESPLLGRGRGRPLFTNMITYKVSKVKNPGKNAVEGTQYFAAKVLLKKQTLLCHPEQREGSLTNVRDDIRH